MRKALVAILLILLLSNCKKNIQSNSAPNYWTVNAEKYNAFQNYFSANFYETRDPSGNNDITLKFSVDTIIQGTYTVVDYQTSITNFPKNSCTVWGYSLKNSDFVTTGKAGDIVNVSKNINGTFLFSFTNISVADSTDNILEVSGKLTSLSF